MPKSVPRGAAVVRKTEGPVQMTRTGQVVALLVTALVVAILGMDWLVARSRLDNVSIEGQLDPPQVVADGKQDTVLTVRVTENGQPRKNDTLQSFLESGSGLLVPEWAFTDQDGVARFTFTPNPLTPYDERETVIHIVSISIGRLVEVDKHFVIEVLLKEPASKAEDSE
jgi:hypothetical protein